MIRRLPFVRKIVYLAVIAVLLLPLAWLSKPATIDATAPNVNQGGLLARLRDKHKLGQANLGEIDPSSEAIKLATLGMRGVAANVLWTKVNHYRKVEDWTSMSATLEQITKLQPNFVTVWRFQGWNLAYNISVEFDDYHDRYYWVIRGIDFLRKGTEYNDREPILLWDMGHFTSHKIGRSDEHRLFRKLFAADDDFHGNRPVGQRDNWLVGREKFLEAEQAIRDGKKMKGQSPLIYLSNAPLCLIYHASALEEEGNFGQSTQSAWDQAARGWTEFGERELPGIEGRPYRLIDMERHTRKWGELRKQIADLAGPGAEAKVAARKRDELTPEMRSALETPLQARTSEQLALAAGATQRLIVTPADLAEVVPENHRAEARRLSALADEQMRLAQYIDTSRNIVNFLYWSDRCNAERTQPALDARKAVYDADQAYRDVEPERALELYEQGFKLWRQVLDQFPSLVEDGTIGDELVRATNRYRRCLKQLERELPEDFILRDVLKLHEPYEPGG